jgi:hypothetical protein
MASSERHAARRSARLLALLPALLALSAWVAPGAPADLPPGGLVPAPRLAADAVSWTPVGVESSYEVAISTAPRGSQVRTTYYLTIPRRASEAQSYQPRLAVGQTAYIGVSADGGRLWSGREIAVRGVAGGGLAAGGPGEGEGEASLPAGEAASPGQATTSGEVAGVEEAEAGEEADGEEAPPAASGGPPAAARRISGTATLASPLPIIGTNDGAGWGPAAALRITNAHITWDRVDINSWSRAISTSISDGFKVLAIANPVNDSTPLSQVEPQAWGAGVASELKTHPGITLAEAGNESYLKGGVAEPVQYGRMYLAALAAMKAAGIHTPLLFNMTGDYPRPSWSNTQSWSLDSKGGGWLRDAVNGNPGLAAAILANGISIHPYGSIGENNHDDWGTNSAAADEAVAGAVLGSIPPFYITEIGFDLSRCGSGIGACTLIEQASKLRAAYKIFMADPHIAGIWWYQSHDDSTGRFGFMNRLGTVRPAFNALSAIARAAGQ